MSCCELLIPSRQTTSDESVGWLFRRDASASVRKTPRGHLKLTQPPPFEIAKGLDTQKMMKEQQTKKAAQIEVLRQKAVLLTSEFLFDQARETIHDFKKIEDIPPSMTRLLRPEAKLANDIGLIRATRRYGTLLLYSPGGKSWLYAAETLSHPNELVSIKIIDLDAKKSTTFTELYLYNVVAQATGSILAVKQWNTVKRQIILEMAFVSDSFQNMIADHRINTISMELLAQMSGLLACAIARLHAIHVIHANLKPMNVLFVNMKLVLGGVGKAVFLPSAERKIKRSDFYRPLINEKQGTAQDVWSFGMIVLEMFCLRATLGRVTFQKLFPSSKETFLFDLLQKNLGSNASQRGANIFSQIMTQFRAHKGLQGETDLGEDAFALKSDAAQKILAAIGMSLTLKPEERVTAKEIARVLGVDCPIFVSSHFCRDVDEGGEELPGAAATLERDLKVSVSGGPIANRVRCEFNLLKDHLTDSAQSRNDLYKALLSMRVDSQMNKKLFKTSSDGKKKKAAAEEQLRGITLLASDKPTLIKEITIIPREQTRELLYPRIATAKS